jgi:hypothetical protein
MPKVRREQDFECYQNMQQKQQQKKKERKKYPNFFHLRSYASASRLEETAQQPQHSIAIIPEEEEEKNRTETES